MAGDLCYKFDEHGIIYREELNNTRGYGDSCAETMRYFHLLFCRATLLGLTGPSYAPQGAPKFSDLHSIMYNFFVSPTQIVRAPVNLLPKEWGDPVKDIPGDQTNPMMLCLGIAGFEDIREDFFEGLTWRYQNGDLITPHAFNIMRRSQNQEPSNLLDYGLYGTVLTRCGYIPFWDSGTKKLRWGDPDDVADDINLIHCFLQAEYRGTTKTGRKALVKYFRDRVTPTDAKYSFNKPLSAVLRYYRTSEWIGEMYIPVMEYLAGKAKKYEDESA
jgi:hypothetical protein